MRRTVLLAAATLALVPAGARAQINQLPPAQNETTPTVVVGPPTAGSNGGGLKTWQQLLIFGAAGILLLGIAWAIVTDARSRAPLKEGETYRADAGSHPRRSARERERARARAKAARAQRKRSR